MPKNKKLKRKLIEQEIIKNDVKTFRVYRKNAKILKADHQKENYNAPDQVQFEGIVFSDGLVVIRWLTANKSLSVWEDIDTLKKVHIYQHPDYGTRIEWSDGTIEEL